MQNISCFLNFEAETGFLAQNGGKAGLDVGECLIVCQRFVEIVLFKRILVYTYHLYLSIFIHIYCS